MEINESIASERMRSNIFDYSLFGSVGAITGLTISSLLKKNKKGMITFSIIGAVSGLGLCAYLKYKKSKNGN